jgi:hypothetical protein
MNFKSILFKLKSTSLSLEDVIKNIKNSSFTIYISSQDCKSNRRIRSDNGRSSFKYIKYIKRHDANLNIIQQTTNSVGEVSSSADMVLNLVNNGNTIKKLKKMQF